MVPLLTGSALISIHHVAVRSYHRRTEIKPHSTATLLAFWADEGAADTFEFKAEFAVGVDPFRDCTGCDNATRIVRAAYIEYLGREPDPPGLATYLQQLSGYIAT